MFKAKCEHAPPQKKRFLTTHPTGNHDHIMTISTGPMLRARPFGNSSWFLQVRVAETSLSEKKTQSKRSKGSKEKSQKSKSSSSSGTLELSEIQELLQRMALDLGALPSEDALGEEREMLELGALESGHSQGFGL